MKFTRLYSIMTEAKIDDLLSKASFEPDVKDQIKATNAKLRNTSKYSKYLIDNWKELSVLDAVELLNDFEKNLARIQQKDIYGYSVDELVQLVSELRTTKSKTQEDKLDPSQATKIFEDDKHLIIAPLTWEASKKYGNGTKWCISSEKTDEHWNRYYDRFLLKPYVIIDKTKPATDPSYKIAVMINTNGTIDSVWQANDKRATKNTITTLAVDKSLLKPRNLDELSIDVKLKPCVRGSYDIKDGLINVTGDVVIDTPNLLSKDGKLTIKFGEVTGDFTLEKLKLTSLEGCPTHIKDSFTCTGNKLTSLEYFPIVDASVIIYDNELTSLKGCPEQVNGRFSCADNTLKTLEYFPKKVSYDINCGYNDIKNLIGLPPTVNGNLFCWHNRLTSLEGCPKKVKGYFNCQMQRAGGRKFTVDEVSRMCAVGEKIVV